MGSLAFAAFALIGYTYFGYPLAVAALARLCSPRSDLEPEQLPFVSVCIAVHNGEKYVAGKIKSLLELDYPAARIEFLFYSDGSTDQTEGVIERFGANDPRIRLIRGAERKGKPTALNALSRAASGDVLLMTDIRPPLARETVRALVAPLGDPRVGCVSGNLVLTGSTGPGAYWRYEKFIRTNESRLGKMVQVSGTIYAMRRRDFPTLPGDIILDDVWVPMQMVLAKKRILFAEAAQAYEDAFDDDREFGRKVRTLAGNYQLLAAAPRLLSPLANPAWFQLMSHKVLRLVCPWALAVLLGASVAAAFNADVQSPAQRTFWLSAVLLQCAFYALAAVGARAGRIASLARTFVVLNAAAVLGLWRFARGEQRITW
jgi:biofilm PGA synthesis N-glycosyltransferase PgaC